VNWGGRTPSVIPTLILALEIVSPVNQHCANCIGTLSFPIVMPAAAATPGMGSSGITFSACQSVCVRTYVHAWARTPLLPSVVDLLYDLLYNKSATIAQQIELTELQPQRRTGGGILRPPCRRNIEFLFSFFLANGATPRPWWSVAPRFDRSSLNEANNPVAKTWRSHHAARYWAWVRSKRPRSKTAPTVVR